MNEFNAIFESMLTQWCTSVKCLATMPTLRFHRHLLTIYSVYMHMGTNTIEYFGEKGRLLASRYLDYSNARATISSIFNPGYSPSKESNTF